MRPLHCGLGHEARVQCHFLRLGRSITAARYLAERLHIFRDTKLSHRSSACEKRRHENGRLGGRHMYQPRRPHRARTASPTNGRHLREGERSRYMARRRFGRRRPSSHGSD